MTRVAELSGRLAAAKEALRKGLRRALRDASPGDQAAATLIAGAKRMADLSNAAALLCRYGRGAESESLVKGMVVTALAMCWAVSAEDMGEALRRETRGLQIGEEDAAPAGDRLDLSGLADSEAEAAEAVLRRMGVSPADAAPGEVPTPEQALDAADRAMTAALWALEKRWPAAFSALPGPAKGLLICSPGRGKSAGRRKGSCSA